jgi:hypothetical protein
MTGLVAATLTVATAGAVSAAPQQVTCGGTVSGHARLDRDLTCTGDGVTMADGATLDLGGHQLAGSGTGVGVTTSLTGTSTIINGTLEGWDRAVAGGVLDFDGGALVAVKGVRFVDNTAAALSVLNATVTVDSAHFRGGGIGAQVVFGGSLTVSRSTFGDVRIGTRAFLGRLSVTGSSFAGSETAISCDDADCDVTGNALERNGTALGTFLAGLTAADNDITGNDVGYEGSLSGGDLRGNRFRGNGTAVQVGDSARVELRENVFVNNDIGLRVANPEESGTVIADRNTFRQNGDGILVKSAREAILSRNTAIRNARWGIFAPGAFDRGGNVARDNGNEPQCVGVVCTVR